MIDRTLSEILEAEQRIASVFRFVAAFGSSILIGSPIILGSAFTYYSLFFFRARVRPGSSFLGGSPIRTRPLLIIAHGGISTGCRESCWMGCRLAGVVAFRHITSPSPSAPALQVPGPFKNRVFRLQVSF